ncbi:hypothetical protein WJX81_007081 [Elliptochloris bilobata]|uniref:Auto-transporter adhesin head GIN domain-containing protein n=1 Tax=Elliptochloris bilobata TaxID=381761 RepID=A0AAW1S1K3_9CHLO
MDAPASESGSEDAPEVRQLQPFTKLQIKVPFNVLVNVTASSVRIISAGVGQVAVAGIYSSARVTASGTGSVYVSGVTGSVTATVSGIGNLFVEAANPGVTIDATIFGLGKVEYNQGQCKGSTNAVFGSTCQRSSAVAPPSLAATWTCGIQVTGVWSVSGSRAGGATPLNTCNTTRRGASAGARAAAPATGAVSAQSVPDAAVSRSAATVAGADAPADTGDAGGLQLVAMNGVVMNGMPLSAPLGAANGQLNGNGWGSWGTGNGQGNGGSGNGIGNIGTGNGNGNGNGNGRRRRR